MKTKEVLKGSAPRNRPAMPIYNEKIVEERKRERLNARLKMKANL